MAKKRGSGRHGHALGVAVMALEVQLWAQVVPGGTLRTGGDAG